MAEVIQFKPSEPADTQADLIAEVEVLLDLVKSGAVIAFVGAARFNGGNFHTIAGGGLGTAEALGLLDLTMHEIRQTNDESQD